MSVTKFIPFVMFVAAICAEVDASTGIDDCAAGLTDNAVQFASAIQYDTLQHKHNPTVHLLLNGKPVKMMLDTGSNVSSVWDASVLDESPGPDSHTLHAHLSVAEARTVEATVEDSHGNALRKAFYVLADSVLAAEGYAGILSPQALADENALLIDFEKNCFFISSPFDISDGDEVDVDRGRAIANPYQVMGIPVEFDGRQIALVVDSGSSVTRIHAPVVASQPKGQKAGRTMDLLGGEVQQDEHTRLVDLKINGRHFKEWPVVPGPALHDSGIQARGYIGMDILKDRVIYYDGTRNEFIFMTRRRS